MLVNCAAYQDGRRIADLTVDEISDYVGQPDCFVWVALSDPDDAELEKMRVEFELHSLAIDDARRGHQRPKIEEYGESLFVVLQTITLLPKNELSIGEVDIFVGRNYILSVRHRTPVGFADVRERCEREPELLKNGPVFVLYALMDTIVDRYLPAFEALEVELEKIEEGIFSKSSSIRLDIEKVYALKRKLMTLQHTVAPLIEVTGKLHGGRVPQLCQAMQEYFRDVSDHIIRIHRSIESAREMTTTAIQVNLSLISLSESEVTKKLAAYGALFAIPTAIAGIYGMNFKYMPEIESKFGYPIVLAVMVLTDIALWWRFRKEKWL
jgi:magnesium transporter